MSFYSVSPKQTTRTPVYETLNEVPLVYVIHTPSFCHPQETGQSPISIPSNPPESTISVTPSLPNRSGEPQLYHPQARLVPQFLNLNWIIVQTGSRPRDKQWVSPRTQSLYPTISPQNRALDMWSHRPKIDNWPWSLSPPNWTKGPQ